jgi:hypothetical protein
MSRLNIKQFIFAIFILFTWLGSILYLESYVYEKWESIIETKYIIVLTFIFLVTRITSFILFWESLKIKNSIKNIILKIIFAFVNTLIFSAIFLFVRNW